MIPTLRVTGVSASAGRITVSVGLLKGNEADRQGLGHRHVRLEKLKLRARKPVKKGTYRLRVPGRQPSGRRAP